MVICAGCDGRISLKDGLCPHCGRFVLGDLTEIEKAQRAAARGVLPVVLGSVGVWLVCVVSAAAVLATRDSGHSRVREAKVDAQCVHPVAEKWVVDHSGECPTLERLRADKEISPGSKIDDPWGHRYRITCEAEDVFVRSDGPDGRSGTADDIVYPDARP